ncbi:MAG: hypothetical protein ACI4XW_00835, partial [Candidatus Spyradocola sp.]
GSPGAAGRAGGGSGGGDRTGADTGTEVTQSHDTSPQLRSLDLEPIFSASNTDFVLEDRYETLKLYIYSKDTPGKILVNTISLRRVYASDPCLRKMSKMRHSLLPNEISSPRYLVYALYTKISTPTGKGQFAGYRVIRRITDWRGIPVSYDKLPYSEGWYYVNENWFK